MEDQNGAIQQKQKQLSAKKKELSEVTGWFKGRKKKNCRKKLMRLKSQIRRYERLPSKDCTENRDIEVVQEFLKDFKDSSI
ncbi:MAG: hypothetical protein ACLTTJ_03245 [Blautia sp.]